MMTIDEALDALESQYDAAVERLRSDILSFAKDGALPVASARAGRYSYPRLLLHYDGTEPESRRSRAFGRLNREGVYSTTVTRPSRGRHSAGTKRSVPARRVGWPVSFV